MRYVFTNSISVIVSENFFTLALQIYIGVTKKIAFLKLNDVSVAQFTKSRLSRGLYKTPIRTSIDLGRKISLKVLFALMQK